MIPIIITQHGRHIHPLISLLQTCGRKNQSKVGQEWWHCRLVDFCPKWHPPYLAELATAYYVGHFWHLATWAVDRLKPSEHLQPYLVAFEGEGGADQSVDQLVDLAHSLRGPAGQSGRGGAEQLAMHCQWWCDDNKNDNKKTSDDHKNENEMICWFNLKLQLPLHPSRWGRIVL